MANVLKRAKFIRHTLSAAACMLFFAHPAIGQPVVDVSGTAGQNQAFYANWGPNANAASPPNSSYNNYRKAEGAGTATQTAADNGDGTATWSGLDHNINIKDTGMFFGQTPSSSSYSDAKLLLGAMTDGQGNGEKGDTQARRAWDFRIGFTESPTDWQAGKLANSGSWDMWTGDHGSDTVYMQFFLQATDSPDVDTEDLIENTNQHLFINSFLRAQVGSGGLIAQVGNEINRDSWAGGESAPVAIYQPAEMSVDGVSVTADRGNTTHKDTGIAYGDLAPVEWAMELNDPGNADPVLAREVKFTFNVGDVLMTQVFDPGGTDLGTTDDDAIPNPTLEGVNPFDDGYFDWQNAYPIFFGAPAGAGAGTTAVMGFEGTTGIPGDHDGDNDVDGADFLGWQRDDPSQIPVWQANYPTPLGASVAAVPEPTSVGLLIVMAAVGWSRRPIRRSQQG